MLLCLLLFFLCLCFPEISGSGIKNGLTLIAGQVLPALYPFLLLTTFFRYLSMRRGAGPICRFLSAFSPAILLARRRPPTLNHPKTG